eukprot:TRINITY_DN6208_c0_g1_i2.p1 TRINITY_DN6208_c0_g1~~TRINITY_DN6208_c0_g1_i2.p1  ORF type:complete len:454 (+),score=165.16 TRINITY_DN6208_c0_g1_i2:66-1364(+)
MAGDGVHAAWGDEWTPEADAAPEGAPTGAVPPRLRRAELVLSRRCGDVLLVLDRVSDKHNIRAVMRTAEALGVQHLWTVEPSYIKGLAASDVAVPAAEAPEDVPPHAEIVGELHTVLRERGLGAPSYDAQNVSPKGFAAVWRVTCTLPDGRTVVGRPDKAKKAAMRCAAEEAMLLVHPSYTRPVSRGLANPPAAAPSGKPLVSNVAKGADRWLTLREFATSGDCLAALRAEGWAVWATALGADAMELGADLPAAAFPKRLALVIGGEALGVSGEMLSGCDRQVFLPMTGFTESLNLSVATALVLQRVFDLKYRGAAPGDRGELSVAEKNALRGTWWDHLAPNPTARHRFEDFAPLFHTADLEPLADVRALRDADRAGFAAASSLQKNWGRRAGAIAAGAADPQDRGTALPTLAGFAAGVAATLVLQKALSRR